MRLSLQNIIQTLNIEDDSLLQDYGEVNIVFIDSRKILKTYNTALFIAIKGNRHDGHDFILSLYRKGVKHFLVNQGVKLPKIKGINYYKVPDTLNALQTLAKQHRESLMLEDLVAVTGSNGKTIVKEWLHTLLCASDNMVQKSPKSYNSQIGVSLSLLMLKLKSNYAILEAGISKPNEMEKLANMLKPNIGVLTNVYEAHQENFSSKSDKINNKLQLFSSCHTIVYYGDDEQVHSKINTLYALKKLYSWGSKSHNTLIIESEKKHNNSQIVCFSFEKKHYKLIIPFIDKASRDNVLISWLTAKIMGVSDETLQEKILKLKSVTMRLETQFIDNANSVVINDTYNSDLYSLKIALDYMIEHAMGRKKVLFLSDIFQSGVPVEEMFETINSCLATYKIDQVYFVGSQYELYRDKVCIEKAYFFKTTQECLKFINTVRFVDDIVFLLKGARTFSFYKLARMLSNQNFGTELEINKQHTLHNLQVFQSKLPSHTNIIAMIKASAYGSGAIEMSKILENEGRITHFGVAHIEEGIELRNSGIQGHILIFNPIFQNINSLITSRLEPCLFSLESLKAFLQAIGQLSFLDLKKPYPVHINIETGMHRLGFEEKEIEPLISLINKNKESILVISVYSHLVASEKCSQDTFSYGQIHKFKQLSDAIEQGLGYPVKRHILNSHGILRFPEHALDYVRLGIGLYGVSECEELKPVHKLFSRIIQIKHLDSKEKTIGYSRRGTISRPTTIATLMIGYADGVSRALGNGNWQVLVNGKLCPTIGDICMDMMMIDVSGVDCQEGNQVEIFGESNTLVNMAKTLNTIPYEILTSISSRLNKTTLELR